MAGSFIFCDKCGEKVQLDDLIVWAPVKFPAPGSSCDAGTNAGVQEINPQLRSGWDVASKNDIILPAPKKF